MDEILNHDSKDTFNKLLNSFLDKNAISGVQPKTVAIVKDKESLLTKEYIIKTWGEEFPNLAENEYFCLKAVEKAGVEIPNIKLSKNKRFLLVENFIFKDGEVFGFEEVLSLIDKNRIYKYQGNYEQVSKVILQFSTNKTDSMKQFFKTIVMNYLLKNGDAHLKNFGLLFSKDFSFVRFAPAYDVVTTTAYIFKDKPALTFGGKKIWYSKSALVDFGKRYCLLSEKEALKSYDECKNALVESIKELEEYIAKNPHFKTIGKRMLDSWRLSLTDIPIKEIADDIIRAWRED
jgi:serine/threonine-protein kinase HipA